jgi:urease gamma subunit
MITLTYDEAVALLNRAVQEKGEDGWKPAVLMSRTVVTERSAWVKA